MLLYTGIIISGSLYLLFDYLKKPALKYFFKPFTTILIIILAGLQLPDVSETYRYLIISGLIFSLLGDVFIMLPSDKFLAGLASFLVALVLYTLAFAGDFGPYFVWGLLIPVVIYAVIFLKVILPYTCTLKIPVVFYALVLSIFLWQALGRAWFLGETSAQWALFGALLFVVSDSLLAYDHFVKRFRSAQLLIVCTYWMAQVLIALSI